MMMDCDTLFMIGSRFPYSEFLPKEGQARGVQIDLDPKMVSMRYPMEVNLIGDSAATLRKLLPLLERKQDRSWREKIEKNIKEWWEILENRAMNGANPLNPQRVFWELSPRLPENCIIACDTGSGTNWYARDIKIRRGMMASVSGSLATMGPGMPYAIAAKFAYPGPPGLGPGRRRRDADERHERADHGREILEAVARPAARSCSRSITAISTRSPGRCARRRAIRNSSVAADCPTSAIRNTPSSSGSKASLSTSPTSSAAAWEAAFAADRPVVLEAKTDPDVPPLPPHITLKQAKALPRRCSRAIRAKAGDQGNREGAGLRPAAEPALIDRRGRRSGARSRRRRPARPGDDAGAAGAARAAAARRIGGSSRRPGLPRSRRSAIYRLIERSPRTSGSRSADEHIEAARDLNGAAALLSFSVLTDSAMEHYRGAYHNPAMYLAPTVGGLARQQPPYDPDAGAFRAPDGWRCPVLTLATGLGGLGFHLLQCREARRRDDLAQPVLRSAAGRAVRHHARRAGRARRGASCPRRRGTASRRPCSGSRRGRCSVSAPPG